jgi:hypothetical protein
MINATKATAFVAGVSQPPLAFIVRNIKYGDILVIGYFLVTAIVLVIGVPYVVTTIRGIRDPSRGAAQNPNGLARMWRAGGIRMAVWFGGVVVGGVTAILLPPN